MSILGGITGLTVALAAGWAVHRLSQAGSQRCPECSRWIDRAATACAYCGSITDRNRR